MIDFITSSQQVCCKDLWYLETERPPAPGRVQLVRASTHSLEVIWNPVATADAYVLQVQKYDMPPGSTTTAHAQPTPTITPAAPTMPPAVAMPSLPTQPLVQLPTQPAAVTMSAPPPMPAMRQAPPIIRTAVTPTMSGPRQTAGSVVRVRAPAPLPGMAQPIKVVGAAPGAQGAMLGSPAGAAAPAGISGIDALAAAAASKQRITTVQGSPIVSSAAGQTIKVKICK